MRRRSAREEEEEIELQKKELLHLLWRFEIFLLGNAKLQVDPGAGT